MELNLGGGVVVGIKAKPIVAKVACPPWPGGVCSAPKVRRRWLALHEEALSCSDGSDCKPGRQFAEDFVREANAGIR